MTDTSFWDRLVEEFQSLGETVLEWIVLIAIALVVLIIGRWILKWVRKVVERLLGASALDSVWDRSGVNRALEGSNQTAASITGTVIYAYLMVGLFLIVVRILKLDTIEDLLERLLGWLPTVFVAAAIVIIAAAVANWSADLVRPFAEGKNVGWLTWLIRVGIIIFGLLFALDLLEITFAEDVVKIIVAAIGVSLAVAFGVGGIDTAKLWWKKYASPGSGSGGMSSHDGGQNN